MTQHESEAVDMVLVGAGIMSATLAVLLKELDPNIRLEIVELQESEFAAAEKGFTAVKHQREVGTGYFDAVTQAIQQGQSSTTALHGSTEDEQFFDKKVA